MKTFDIITDLAHTFSETKSLNYIRVFSSLLLFSLLNKFFKSTTRDISLLFSGNQIKIRLCDTDDLIALHEIFSLESYLIDSLEDPEIIFDAGANHGIASVFFAVKYPKATIFAFEPSNKAFVNLAWNTEPFSNIVKLNFAIDKSTGSADFFELDRTHSSSLINRGGSKYTVRTMSILDFMSMNKIDYIDLFKFDIEGAEFRICGDFKPSHIKNLVGEIHYDLRDEQVPEDLGLRENYTVTVSGGDRRGIIKASEK